MHAYDPKTGEPVHQVPYADPNRGMRDTTLRDVKKLGLYPSVNEYLNIIAKPWLSSWQVRTAISNCYNNPRKMDEDESIYLGRISDISTKAGEEIMGFGTEIHAQIEAALKGGEYTHPEIVNPVLELFADNNWKILELETVILSKEYPYGGTADVVYSAENEYGIIDFKTCKDATKPFANKSYVMQIAMYHMAEHGFIGEKAAGYNIFISRDENIGAVKAVRYDCDDLSAAWEAAKSAIKLWQYTNDYYPEL